MESEHGRQGLRKSHEARSPGQRRGDMLDGVWLSVLVAYGSIFREVRPPTLGGPGWDTGRGVGQNGRAGGRVALEEARLAEGV